HRADLFSLGSVLYTMASGRPPFRANNTLAILKRVAEDTPRPIPEIIPEVPEWLCDLIARLHAKKPADRIGTAQEGADLLGPGLGGGGRGGGGRGSGAARGECPATAARGASGRGRGAAARQGSCTDGGTPKTPGGGQAAVPRPLLGGRRRRVPDACRRPRCHG